MRAPDGGFEHDLLAEAAPDEGWPEPVTFDTPDLPSIDPAWIPGWAGRFVTALADATETPPELAAVMVLTTASCAIAGKADVQIHGDYREPLNLWMACALPPGNRKSAVASAATAPLSAWEKAEAARLRPEIEQVKSERASAEARVKKRRGEAAGADAATFRDLSAEIADMEANLPDVPIAPRLWTSDCTPERLGVLLADHRERMAWLSSEGGLFETMAGRYSGGVPNLDLLLKAHSGDGERIDRGGRDPVHLDRPLLTIGMAIQPDVLSGLASKPGFRGRGLIARFLFLAPKSLVGYRALEHKPIVADVQRAYAEGIGALLDLPHDVPAPAIRMSDAAMDIWRAYARDVETSMRPGGALEHAADWGGKAPGAAARLAGVLHCIEHAHRRPWDAPISKGAMVAALTFMEVVQVHTLSVLGVMGADPVVASAKAVWRWIEGGRRERFTVRECHQALKGTFHRVDDLRAALAVLGERYYLTIVEPVREGAGRPPSPVVMVNPLLLRAWR